MDTDGCESAAEYCDILLTSVMKGMDVAVQKSIQAAVQGKFSNEPYVGTLENGGVGLAPYHDADSTIPDATKTEIDEIRYKLLKGDIKIQSKAVPKADLLDWTPDCGGGEPALLPPRTRETESSEEGRCCWRCAD